MTVPPIAAAALRANRPEPDEIALDVQDLSVTYGDGPGHAVVVHEVSLELRRGEVLGLAGESGCGKSTTALCAIGYVPHGAVATGRAMFCGTDLLATDRRQLRRVWGRSITYVPQNAATALNPALRVGAQLAQPLLRHTGLRGEAAMRRVYQLLEIVEIPGAATAATRYPHQFSGGQQQRIVLAMALACDPSVLVLDEPTTGLDVTTQASIARLLRTVISDRSVAALYISHDLALLGSLADRLAILYAGEVVEAGRTQTVLRQPGHPYTRALIRAIPDARDDHRVTGIPGRPPTGASMSSCAFAARCSMAIDLCRERHVEMKPVGPGHAVRCVRANDRGATVLRERPTPVPASETDEGREAVLVVDDIVCGYDRGRATAVSHVSFEVYAGETVGVVGESGSGKSTLLRVIAGLHRPTAGRVLLNGVTLAASVRRRPREVKRDMQLVFQNPDSSLNPAQTIEQIVRRSVRLFRGDVPRSHERGALEEALAAVGLGPSLLDRYPRELSGGQKQRVALARAFAARPRVLLCDEVTSALDVSVQATILDLLANLAAEVEASIVLVTHDLGVVRNVAQRTVVLRGGELCEQGSTHRVFDQPETSYMRSLMASVPVLHAAPADEPQQPPDPAPHISS